MINVELLTDPVLITLTGSEQTLPAGIVCLKPNSGCVLTSLKKKGSSTNYAATYAGVAITSDNYTYFGCGGANKTWEKLTGTAAGTLWAYKMI